MWNYSGLSHMAFGSFGMILFWVVLFGVMILVARALLGLFRPLPGRRPRALEVLDERYARGQIDHSEFDRKRRQLTDPGNRAGP